jgi:hypothetical protein
MQLTDRLLVEVALLLIGLTKISLTKFGFDRKSVTESPLRLWSHAEEKHKMISVRKTVCRLQLFSISTCG